MGIHADAGQTKVSDEVTSSNDANSAEYTMPHTSSIPNQRGFKIASLNIVSLVKHIDELRILMADQRLDILSINETRLDPSIKDEAIKLNGYKIIRRDRNRFGGGVALFIRNSININLRSDLSTAKLEAISLEIIKPKSKPFIITAAYRPPSADVTVFDELAKIIETADFEDKEIILMGDLNCNLLTENPDHNVKQLNSICEIYQLQQLINSPTRITESSNTLIDIIITNMPSRIVTSGVIHIGISDHSLVYAVRKFSIPPKNKPKYLTSRQFKNFKSEKFRDELKNISWDTILMNINDPNEMWEKWKEIFLEIANKHAPIKTRRVRNKDSPWLTSQIRRLIIERDGLKKQAIKSGNINHWKLYKSHRNKAINAIKTAKSEYYKNQIKTNSNNPRAVWKTINQLMARKTTERTIDEILINNETITDPKLVSQTMNMHFAKVGPKLAANLPEANKTFDSYIKPSNSSFQIATIKSNTVLKLLTSLSTNKATGLDNISCRLAKEAAPVISDSLCVIFNRSINSGIFPSDWKIAKVSPVYKSEERNNPNNYRPISVISVIAKTFEKIIFDQLYNYLTINKLLNESQSGFRPRHSTLTALLNVTNDWYSNIDDGLLNLVIFLDLKKAFDTVDHAVLLKKLELYGIKGLALSWFKSYLTDRQQKCSINGNLSQSCYMTHGVPQGSTLGPLLFLLYINDLPNCLQHSSARMYADDTNLTITTNTITKASETANEDLENVKQWLLANKLSLNLTKTEYMIIASNYKLNNLGTNQAIHIDNIPVKRVYTTKALGVHIDDQLIWSNHVEYAAKKISSALGGLRRARSYVPSDTLISIYHALIQPLFDYCDVVWGNINKGLNERLQKLQNRAARIITRSNYDVRSVDILKQLKWDNLSQRRFEHKATIMYNIMNGKAPKYLRMLFNMNNKNELYDFRDKK